MDPEVAASNYAWLVPLGMIGMFVANWLASLVYGMSGTLRNGLPYWWAYPILFPAIAALFIMWKRTGWLLTSALLLLVPVLYFTWFMMFSDPDPSGSHPVTGIAVTIAITMIASWGAERQRRSGRRI